MIKKTFSLLPFWGLLAFCFFINPEKVFATVYSPPPVTFVYAGTYSSLFVLFILFLIQLLWFSFKYFFRKTGRKEKTLLLKTIKSRILILVGIFFLFLTIKFILENLLIVIFGKDSWLLKPKLQSCFGPLCP